MGQALHTMRLAAGGWLTITAGATIFLIFVVPILLGMRETILPAFGILPAIGETGLDLAPWRQLWALPGIATSVRLSLTTGLLATALSLVLAISLCAVIHGRTGASRLRWTLSPLLATPHAAMAVGLAFLIAPSGWIARLIADLITGWRVPPQLMSVNDPAGLALVFGLVVKELPFFLLVILSALNQVPVRQQMAVGESLGYGPGVVWIKIILPQVYPQIRLAVFAVLVFSLSVVDMALILGPSNPPLLSVYALRLFQATDLQQLLPAAAAAVLQMALVAAGALIWLVGERLIGAIGRPIVRRGGRGLSRQPLLHMGAATGLFCFLAGFFALLALLIWSFAWRWSFPDVLPSSFTLAQWRDGSAGWGRALGNTLSIGAGATLGALMLAVLWLEAEDRRGRRTSNLLSSLLYLPLMIPQIGFLYGLQVVFLKTGLSGSLPLVLWGHTIFVFPYVVLSLADAWRALDPRYARSAAALGANPLRILLCIKLPVLLRPILTAAAIGFSVSVAQFLPTLFLGAGRVVTLTTETVALSSSGDRRIVGAYASLQALLPFVVFALALGLPRYIYANRRALKGE
jgi:putative thiamine transport system permease protein